MDCDQTVLTFIEFFAERGHELTKGSSLLPPQGDSVLYTSAGMQPLTRYLEGAPHPLGARLAGVQRCLRTTDLDDIGDYTHLTVFEMLGSWSLGDYGGPQSLRWGLELMSAGFGIEQGRLYATAFGGNDEVGPDIDAVATWRELGLPVELGGPQNWWSNGPTGPCGPDSEIFVWMPDGPPAGSPLTDERWVELWNHVTMRYRRLNDGRLEALARPSVDTGMGLERLLMVTQHVGSVFETDLIAPWLSALLGLWPGLAGNGGRPLRIVVDHLRSAVAVIGDGVLPASNGRGYVLRRLLRRALIELWRADGSATLADLPPGLVEQTLDHFGQQAGPGFVGGVLAAEQGRFAELLTRGRAVLRRLYPDGALTERDYRFLHETHGLPGEIVTELAAELRP